MLVLRQRKYRRYYVISWFLRSRVLTIHQALEMLSQRISESKAATVPQFWNRDPGCLVSVPVSVSISNQRISHNYVHFVLSHATNNSSSVKENQFRQFLCSCWEKNRLSAASELQVELRSEIISSAKQPFWRHTYGLKRKLSSSQLCKIWKGVLFQLPLIKTVNILFDLGLQIPLKLITSHPVMSMLVISWAKKTWLIPQI